MLTLALVLSAFEHAPKLEIFITTRSGHHSSIWAETRMQYSRLVSLWNVGDFLKRGVGPDR